MYQQSFKSQVRALCEKRGWEFQDLAEELGVTPGALSHLLGREMAVTKEKIEAVARALEIQPWEIDLYVVKMLPDLARNAPALIDIGRSLLKAGSPREFAKVQNRLADVA